MWLVVLEQREYMLSAFQRPVGQEPVVVVGQSASATNRDQPKIAFSGKDRHPSSRTTQKSGPVRLPAVRQGGHPRDCLLWVARRSLDEN